MISVALALILVGSLASSATSDQTVIHIQCSKSGVATGLGVRGSCSLGEECITPDLSCFVSGDEMEVKPATVAAAQWMGAERFVAWKWVDGYRVPLIGIPYSPGFHNSRAFLSYATEAGIIPEPKCWDIAAREGRGN